MLRTCLAHDLVLNFVNTEAKLGTPWLTPTGLPNRPAPAPDRPWTQCQAFRMCSESPGPLIGITWEALTMADVWVLTQKIRCHCSRVQAGRGNFKLPPGDLKLQPRLGPALHVFLFSAFSDSADNPTLSCISNYFHSIGSFSKSCTMP